MSTYKLLYRDGEGELSERVVEPLPPPWEVDGAFDARCQRAGAPRSFKWSRVQQALDMDTGELLSASELLTRLAPSHGAQRAIAIQLAPLARCLIAFGRQELAHFDARRRRVIAEELIAHLGPTAGVSLQWVGRYLQDGVPDSHRMRESAAELAEELNEVELQVAYVAALRMAVGSGRAQVSPELQARLDEVFGSR